jgi:tight adherence protein C
MSVVALHALLGSAAGLAVWLITLALTRTSSTYRLNRMRVLFAHVLEGRELAHLEAEDLLAAQVAAIPFHRRILKPFWQRSSRTALKYAPTRIIATLQRQLDAAGNPHRLAPHELLVAKAMTFCLGLGLGVASAGVMVGGSGPLRSLLYVLACAGTGFMGPDFWVYRRRRKHTEGIKRALPDVVDLLRVSMEGGLSYDGAVGYVVAKMQNPLTYELNRYLIDRQVGRGQEEAMRALGNRTREADLLSFTEVVVQGEALGTGVGRALRAFSADLRTKRRQRAEKKAHEAAMKMLFPMILLIFPAVFSIIVGPSVLVFMKSFGL